MKIKTTRRCNQICNQVVLKRWVSTSSNTVSEASNTSTPWKFGSVPKGFWSDKSNQRKFFDELAKDIGVKELDDWYEKLNLESILKHGGGAIANKYSSSPVAALQAIYPEHNWKPWKFNNTPAGYLRNVANQRKFFDDIGQQLGVKELDDWYVKFSQLAVERCGGHALRTLPDHTVLTSLMNAYPEHNWIPWKFNSTPRGFWKSKDNQRAFFDWVGKQIGISELDDWYSVLSIELLEKYGGRAILRYNSSVMEALTSCYPEHNWIPWKFNVPQGFWKSVENQRKFFDWLGQQLDVQHLDDWYTKLTFEAIHRYGGGRMVTLYKGSPHDALQTVYPEHNWATWKFNTVKRGYWNSQRNIALFLADLSQKLSIQTLDDWYRVDWDMLHHFGAASVVAKYKGLHNLLKQHYPQHPWDPKKFFQARKAQRWLIVTLKKMYPEQDVFEDYSHPEIILPSSKRPMQLDVFIPSQSLAFEYQGKQHYQEVGMFSPARTYQHRDEEKRTLCAINNIKLIEVPYWWNRSQESLSQIIHEQLKK